MKGHFVKSGIAFAMVLGLVQQLPAATVSYTIDFENLPALPPQPNNFGAAGPAQTYSNADFTVSGGVVLGNPTFLAAFPANGTPPNLYGTTDIADPSLSDTITLMFSAADSITGVSGVLFNGQPIAEDYTVSSFSGATPLAGDTFLGVPDTSSPSSFRVFTLSASAGAPITMVTITTPNSNVNGWDFFVDTIHAQTVPEPSSLLLMLTGAGLLWKLKRC
jgi:hypothetical protein